jgi:hypothetical protein
VVLRRAFEKRLRFFEEIRLFPAWMRESPNGHTRVLALPKEELFI